MIKFEDRTPLTYEKAAQLVETEGRLIDLYMVTETRGRCVAGVLIDAKWNEPSSWKYLPDDPIWDKMVIENNSFQGTPEERAAHMARWFRSLKLAPYLELKEALRLNYLEDYGGMREPILVQREHIRSHGCEEL